MKISKVVIFHGTDGSPQGIWIPWLKSELEKSGVKVWAPVLPGNEKPNIDTYNEYILKNKPWEFDNNTAVVGHSSGSVEILGLLEKLPKTEKIGLSILVATFVGDLGWPELKSLNRKFDYKKIKEKCDNFLVIHSDDDPYCPLDGAKQIADNLEAKFVLLKNRQHFSGDTKEFPELLKELKE